MLILKECPTPAKIIEKGIDGIIAIWKRHKIRAVEASSDAVGDSRVIRWNKGRHYLCGE